MANQLATPTLVMKEVGRGYANNIKFVSNLNREYDDQYRLNGMKQGNTAKRKKETGPLVHRICMDFSPGKENSHLIEIFAALDRTR